MIRRTAWRLPVRAGLLRLRAVSRHVRRAPFRSLSTSGSPCSPLSPSGTSAGLSPLLAPFTTELDRLAPYFDIEPSQIRIIHSPAEFYETLKDRIRNARKRIFLSTLYIGKSEQELVSVLQQALRRNPDVRLSVLTDALRGTREAPAATCASLLVPLVTEFGHDRVEVRLYHTPNLAGLPKRLVPPRINEGWGLQHMKLYGVDDEVILSGANLSADYFTNRQDRYHLFSSAEVTNHYWKLHQAVGSISFLLAPSTEPAGFTLTWPQANAAPSPLENTRSSFVAAATKALRGIVAPPPGSAAPPPKLSTGTRVYALAQLTPLLEPDASTERAVIQHVLRTLAAPAYAASAWLFTAGYFNPTPWLTQLLLSTASSPRNTVLTAHPAANGFFRSTGVSGLLPDAYTVLAQRFLHRVHRRGRDGAVLLREWRRGTIGEPAGWTYHAKGLWITLPGDSEPAITLVGSSNYTRRSYSLDLEAGALVITTDEDLRRRLGAEQRHLLQHSTAVTRDDFGRSERRVSLKVKMAMLLVGGAL